MKRFLLALATALVIASPAPALPPRQEPWIEVRTAHFTLFSNAAEKDVRRVGADLERLRDALSQLSPGLALNAPTPSWTFVFKNAASFLPYQRLYGGKPLDSGGYFLAQGQGNYLAVDGNPRGRQTEIVYHEYFHYVARNNYGELPLWLHEGLAEYYSTFQVSKDEARVGLPLAEHVLWLRQNPWIPLAQLLAMDQNSPDYNEGSRRGGFYAESWALTHYLLGGSPQRRSQLADLMRLAAAGTPGKEAFQKVFGDDPTALEKEAHNYVKSYTFPYTRSPIQPEANLTIQVRPMAWPDVLFRLGDLLANLGPEHYAAAEEHFRAALAAQPDHAPSLGGLGYLAEETGHPQEARAFYEKAAKLAPDDFLIQYRYAVNLLEDPGPGSLRTARGALQRAVALRPDFGEAWARLGYTYQGDESLDENAVHVLETAHRLLPSRMDVTHNLAVVYARTGHRDQASELVEKVLAPKADPAMVANARESVLDEDYRHAEELVSQEKLGEAIPILEKVRDSTRQPERRRSLELRLDEIRKALDFNHFVDQYNQAVLLANQGDVKGATAILEPLAETVRDPVQAEQAKNLLARLKPPLKHGKRGKGAAGLN
ncbi:MAG TPA: tetratricopeptide repeat protein [Thermoanaerobaculia bacterium]|nr:tetratricopeptide repeat protein [Thermoanaerobaculia bacterium]